MAKNKTTQAVPTATVKENDKATLIVPTATKKAKADKADALQEIGNKLLKSHPNMHTVYVTADGTAFAAGNDAENHAKELKNHAITVVKRQTAE